MAISNALSDGRDSDSDGSSLTAFGNVNASAQNLNELVLLSVTVNNRDEREYTGLIISLLGTGGYSYSEIVDVPSEVPVPAALPLMASALGLFGLSRRKNNVAAV